MLTTKLFEPLKAAFENAAEIWVAVALMKEEAFEEIRRTIPSYCKQHYIVGIDLPSSPGVFRTFKNLLSKDKFEAGIYREQGVSFHPKVYLIKGNNQYIAFIGSANYTNGGLKNNVELNYKVIDQKHCLEILEWFKDLQKNIYPLTTENISNYEEYFEELQKLKRNAEAAQRRVELSKADASADPLIGINFNGRYFSKEHHLAFRRELWYLGTAPANKERQLVSNQFFELHEEIFPQFSNYGLGRLKPNVKNHLVALYYQLPDKPVRKLDGMWLSYGKDQSEIKQYQALFPKVGDDDDDNLQSFINHARIQIKISLTEIGIWILFGKNNGGSSFDRATFRENMELPDYRQKFYDKVKQLPKDYWLDVGGLEPRKISSFKDSDELHRYCKNDHISKYFILGRDYKITDPEMSKIDLPKTTLTEFKLLYPIYEFMRDRRFANY